MVYIGIDIAKFKHFASVVSSDGEVIVKPFPFENSRQGFMKLVEEIENFQDCLIGLESTGHYAENLIYFLYERGYKIGVINPIQTDALRDSNIRKTKTDKIDTKLIVQCLMLKKYSLVNSQDLNIIKLRHLSRFKHETIQQQTRIKIQLTTCLDTVFPELSNFFKGNLHSKVSYSLLEKYPSAKAIAHCRIDGLTNLLYANSRGHYNQDRALQLKNLAKQSIGLDNPAIELQIQCLIKQLRLYQKQIKDIDLAIVTLMELINSPILTIPGVGYTLGAMIISEISDIKRFSNPSKLLAFAGLDPVVKQSGNFQASSMKISKRGSTYLRYAIYRVAFLIIHNNETFHDYYISKRAQGKLILTVSMVSEVFKKWLKNFYLSCNFLSNNFFKNFFLKDY